MSIYLAVAKRAARKAGLMLQKHYLRSEPQQVRFKTHNELVTKTDRASERIIISEIKKRFPAHSIISEEGGGIQQHSEYTWTIDPLDGTSGFVIHSPLFGVSIALLKKNQPVLGCTYFPMLKKMYWAETGKDAYCNGKRIHVSTAKSFERATHLFCHGRKPSETRAALKLYGKFLPRSVRLRHLGSASYELSLLASGYGDSYISVGLNHWDLAAGICIVREAGGVVTDGQGNPWTPKSRTTVASNAKFHKKLLRFCAL